jgi:apolipoprotein N-acyltransferase
MNLLNQSGRRMRAGILVSAILSGLCFRGGIGWLLAFVMLVPWLRSLDSTRTLSGSLLSAYAMSVGFTAAVFFWFAAAIGSYTQIGAASGLALLLIAAPLFQPQIVIFALVRHATCATQRHGAVRALTSACAPGWLQSGSMPKLLGDTLGLRVVSLCNCCAKQPIWGGRPVLLSCCCWRTQALRPPLVSANKTGAAHGKPLALAALAPLLLAGYGLTGICPGLPQPAGKLLRIGMVQSNLVDYERQRQKKAHTPLCARFWTPTLR